MKTGTRRMWSRRVLRAGWFLAPVLRVPAALWGFFFGTSGAAWTTVILGLMVFGMGSCVKRDIYLDQVSTGAEIEAAVQDNACMINLMPRRQALDKKGAPLTNRDLVRGKIDCHEHWVAVGQLAEQKETLKRLGAK